MEDNNKRSFSFFRKREEKTQKIEVEFQVEKITLDFSDVRDFSDSHLNSENPKVDEVIVVDTFADERVLQVIRNACKVSVNPSFSVLYLMDAVNESVVRILALCVEAFSEQLKENLSSNNHIIRFTK